MLTIVNSRLLYWIVNQTNFIKIYMTFRHSGIQCITTQTVFSNLIRQCWHLLLHFFHSHNIHQNDNITQSQRIRDHFQCEWTLFESQYRYLLAIELLNLNSQPNGHKEESNRMVARRKATEWPQERKQHLKLTDGINILMEFHR